MYMYRIVFSGGDMLFHLWNVNVPARLKIPVATNGTTDFNQSRNNLRVTI